MAAEIRVDRITSRTGINTISFTGDGFSFLTNVGIGTTVPRDSVKFDVDGSARFNGDVNFAGATGVTSAFFDKSDNSLKFSDGVRAKFGNGLDLHIHHDGANSYISDQGTGQLQLTSSGTAVEIKKNTGEAMGLFKIDGAVELYHDNSKKFETDANGVKVTGICTATQFSGGGIGVGIQSAGNLIGYGITTLNFVGAGNTFAINGTTVDVSIAGGGGGGVSEVSTDVNSVSATGVGSFATATYRSAAVTAQIDQNAQYQVGRYLMIHDGTTVTVVEQAAVSTGSSMLGSFTGAIVGSNAELQVTMANSGIATVITKIDTVSI